MNTKWNVLTILALLLALLGGNVTPAQAATGDLDLTFGMDGVLVTDTSAFFGWFITQHESTQQSDGKIIVGGYYIPMIAADVLPQAELARYSVDGVLDGDFGTGGKIHPQPTGTGGSYIVGVYTGPQDEIIAVGGGFDATRGVPSQIFLARYDSDGTPVADYGTDGVLTFSRWGDDISTRMDFMPMSSALQNDGMVLVAGMYDSHAGGLGVGAFLLRLNLADGTLDSSFGSDGMVLNPEATYAFGQITLQSDGEILVTNSPISSALAIRRFTSTGLPDEGFGTDGVLEIPTLQPQCSALAEGSEGKLYLTAAPSETDFASSDFLLARLNPDGTVDTNFGTDGFVLTDFAGGDDVSCGMLVQADGKIIVGGAAHDAAGGMGPALARYSADGVLDESFGSGGKVITTGLPSVILITELAMTPGGKLLATAFSPGDNVYTTLARYDMSGEIVFTGFMSPVDNPPVMNIAKAGQTIPLKFRLTDANGVPITDLTSVTVTVVSLACTAGTTTDQIEEYAAGSSGLQNLGDGYYQWNWKTPTTYANSCKTLKLDLGEGVGFEHTALFQFRK